MWDLLLALIIIIIIAIIIVWYVSSNIKHQADIAELSLDTNEDKILSQWLKDNITSTFNIDITTEEIAAKFLKRIYRYDVDPKKIIIGTNLEYHYNKISRSKLSYVFTEKDDCILYLRSSIGIDYEICIINTSDRIQKLLYNKNFDVDLYHLNDIIESNIEKKAYDHLRLVLNTRWKKLLETNNPNILERDNNDSYAYLRKNDYENIISLETTKGSRINLLCTSVEFDHLIKRLSVPATDKNQKEKV